MTDRDPLRAALAEALHSLCRMHTTQHGVDAHYDSADAILAHPAVLAALDRSDPKFSGWMCPDDCADCDRSDPAVELRDEDLCSKPVIDWSRGETPTYDTDGRCTICGTRFVVRRQKGVAPPTYVSCPNCECSEFSWRTYSELADAPTASPTEDES